MTKNILNYATFITNYVKKLLEIISKIYYKLRQLKFPQIIDNYYKLCQFSKLLQITSKIIANYGSCFKPKHY